MGRAIALRLARDGFAVTVHCRSRRAEGEAVVAEITAAGGQADLLQFDVADRQACRTVELEKMMTEQGELAFYMLASTNAFSEDQIDSLLRSME